MTRPPLVFRLMLCTLFLPIMIAFGVLWYALLFHAPEHVRTNQAVMLGLPYNWFMYALLALPFVLWLWMLRSGNWRWPVSMAGAFYFTCFLLSAFEIVQEHTPPDKRMIELTGSKGADVYCNGVHLGRLPLNIRVDELKAKVPEWTTPPEQRWYDDAEPASMLYTWYPWDDFRKERYEASKELFGANAKRIVSNVPRVTRQRREALHKHDADCRYWWSFRLDKTQMAFYRNENPYYLNTPFDRESRYYFVHSSVPFSPSAVFHARLLVDVLPDLTPEQKNDWDRHVLKHWPLLAKPLNMALSQAAKDRNRDKNDPLVKLHENALHSTARLKYGLSDPPTEDECRRLLADWVAESIKHNLFHFAHDHSSGEFGSTPAVSDYELLPNNVEEPMRKPLIEQWKKNKYRYENGWTPVAYYSLLHKSPDYFADFARYSATTHSARIALLNNEDSRAAALFNTLLHRQSLANILTPQTYRYAGKIESYSLVDNPLSEAEMRNYIVTALSDPRHNDSSRELVNRAVFNAILFRIHRKDGDKDELAAWVASLPMRPSSKNFALRMLRIRRDDALTFADRLQQAAGQRALIETELTLDDVVKWFAENPESDLVRFLGEQEDNITVSEVFGQANQDIYFNALSSSDFSTVTAGSGEMPRYVMWGELPKYFVIALLRSDTPEGNPQVRDLIRRIWSSTVEEAIAGEYGGANPFRPEESFYDTGLVNLPDYILDLCKEKKYSHLGSDILAPTLALCDSPKAGEILEMWTNEASPGAKPRVERCLKSWRTRSALRQKRMELFQDLVVGRIDPDDLLLQQPPWKWKGGQYIQGE